jgi:polyhydroxybutyrate depolymerase
MSTQGTRHSIIKTSALLHFAACATLACGGESDTDSANPNANVAGGAGYGGFGVGPGGAAGFAGASAGAPAYGGALTGNGGIPTGLGGGVPIGMGGASPFGGSPPMGGSPPQGGAGGTPLPETGGSPSGGTGGVSTTPPGTSPGCTNGSLTPGDSTKTLTHDGQQRQYMVHVPSSYNGSTPVPLVIDIHGLTSSMSAQKGLSGWAAKSDKEGFIVIHPQGLGNSWNGGSLCCGSSQSSGVDDEGFMRAIVKTTGEQGCIDPKRVYATGLSNGGAMSHLLACRAADVFAATAPVSMGNGTRPCQPSRPISVTMFRGTSDTLVSYNGGLFPSAKADFDQWKGLDSCTGSAATSGPCETYTGCAAGTEVTLCTINAGHVLYSAAAQQGAPVPDVVWEMFKRQTLP